MGGPGGRRKRRLEDAERQRGGVGICMRSVIGIRVGSLSLCRLRGDSRAAGCRELLPSERETSIVVGECPSSEFPLRSDLRDGVRPGQASPGPALGRV